MSRLASESLQLLRDVCSGVLDLVYPPFCLVCKRAGDDYLCSECIESIDAIEAPYCRKCGMPCDADDYVCPDCRLREFAFDSACSAATFDGKLRDAIHAFKYQNHIVLADPLAELMVRCFPNTYLAGKVDVVVPIPIHSSRVIERGFNQSEELARRFCARLSIPLCTSAIVKHKRTRHQVDLPQDQRAVNVEGAFRVVNPDAVAGKRVLLMDDVFTTGGTINEAAKVLWSAGATAVYAYTLARSV